MGSKNGIQTKGHTKAAGFRKPKQITHVRRKLPGDKGDPSGGKYQANGYGQNQKPGDTI